MSPVVEAALEQRAREQHEDAMGEEARRLAAKRLANAFPDVPTNELLTLRSADTTVGEEFALTRELRRRERAAVLASLESLKSEGM